MPDTTTAMAETAPLTKEQIAFGPPLPTAEEAAAAHRVGWNLRCNSCGGYGATWVPKMRPGWGSRPLPPAPGRAVRDAAPSRRRTSQPHHRPLRAGPLTFRRLKGIA